MSIYHEYELYPFKKESDDLLELLHKKINHHYCKFGEEPKYIIMNDRAWHGIRTAQAFITMRDDLLPQSILGHKVAIHRNDNSTALIEVL